MPKRVKVNLGVVELSGEWESNEAQRAAAVSLALNVKEMSSLVV